MASARILRIRRPTIIGTVDSILAWTDGLARIQKDANASIIRVDDARIMFVANHPDAEKIANELRRLR